MTEENDGKPIGERLVSTLMTRLHITRKNDLAEYFGKQPAQITNWERLTKITPTVVVNMVSALKQAMEKRALEDHKKLLKEAKDEREDSLIHSINPLIEYAPIEKIDWTTARPTSGNAELKPRGGFDVPLRTQLEHKHGVYVFYDSFLRPIYVGKAKDMDLWQESGRQFRRPINTTDVANYNHPVTNQIEVARKMSSVKFYVCHVACYISAYEIQREMIDSVEALLIRTNWNGLTNKKIESFN